MGHRIVMFTVAQIMLYATLIPMRIAYEVSCQRIGVNCSHPSSPTAQRSQGSMVFSIAERPR